VPHSFAWASTRPSWPQTAVNIHDGVGPGTQELSRVEPKERGETSGEWRGMKAPRSRRQAQTRERVSPGYWSINGSVLGNGNCGRKGHARGATVRLWENLNQRQTVAWRDAAARSDHNRQWPRQVNDL
jgi:hypothetical protein